MSRDKLVSRRKLAVSTTSVLHLSGPYPLTDGSRDALCPSVLITKSLL